MTSKACSGLGRGPTSAPIHKLAERLTKHGLEETEVGIASKLARGTFSATFLLACLAVLEMEGVQLEDL